MLVEITHVSTTFSKYLTKQSQKQKIHILSGTTRKQKIADSRSFPLWLKSSQLAFLPHIISTNDFKHNFARQLWLVLETTFQQSSTNTTRSLVCNIVFWWNSWQPQSNIALTSQFYKICCKCIDQLVISEQPFKSENLLPSWSTKNRHVRQSSLGDHNLRATTDANVSVAKMICFLWWSPKYDSKVSSTVNEEIYIYIFFFSFRQATQ